jgi:hypothetical protein
VIAELVGPLPLKRGDEWLTIGVEGQPHIHLRTADLAELRWSAPDDGNLALEALDALGTRLVRVAFSRTNPARLDCDHDRRAALVARHGGGR